MSGPFQLQVIKKVTMSCWIPRSKPGDLVWVNSEIQAQTLIDQGICRWPAGVQAAVPGPSETPEAGPSEVKAPPAPEVAPNSGLPFLSNERLAGQSTDSAPLVKRGRVRRQRS